MAGLTAAALAELRMRFLTGRNDLDALRTLQDELGRHPTALTSGLLQEVASAIRALASGASSKSSVPFGNPVMPGTRPIASSRSSVSAGNPLATLIDDILARAAYFNQPLYRYRVTDSEYRDLKKRLDYIHSQGGLQHCNDRSAATFVLFVAEWYRREYDGGGYSWDAPYPVGLTHDARRELAVRGLKWWGRPLKRSSHSELRLMSLALEGGFPTRLLESRENGRIAQHLSGLLERVEATSNLDISRAAIISHSMGAALGTYDHEEFHALCAELVITIARLKAEAHANAPATVPTTAWLDATRPTWRDDLPIGFVGESIRHLLDELVSAKSARLTQGVPRVTRLLVCRSGEWMPALRLGLSGEIDLPRARFRPADGRIRLRAAGQLASLFAGELGLLEAPTSDDQPWLCRPRGGRDLEAVAPFEVKVEVELQAGASRDTIVWPGGEPLRSDVLILADEREEVDEASPERLTVIGRGSIRTRKSRVYCMTPLNFDIRPIEGGTSLSPIWSGSGFKLFRVEEPMRVGDGEGDDYRIEVGADGEERAEQLVIEGTPSKGVETEDVGLVIYSGPPALRTRTRSEGRMHLAPPGEIRWRHSGQTTWHEWPSVPFQLGRIEVVWRDPNSRALRDRARFIVLPKQLEIRTRSAGRYRTAIDLDAPAGWQLAATTTSGLTVDRSANGLEVEFRGRPERLISLFIEGPRFTPLPIRVQARLTGCGFFWADGRLLDERKVIIDDLRGATAFGDGNERIYLTGPERTHSQWDFANELPLWSLSEDVRRLLSGGRELDDRVTIEFGRGGANPLSVGRYSVTMASNPAGLVYVEPAGAPESFDGCRIEWFSILETRFHVLSERSSFAKLADACVGPGLAVLRKGGRIIGRPTFVQGRAMPTDLALSELQLASTAADPNRRIEQIASVIDRLCEATPAAARNRDYLKKLIVALGGMPPSALDVLKALGRKPTGLAVLIATATDEASRIAIWALERDLPFLWCTIPLSVWKAAFDLQRNELVRLLSSSGIEPEQASGIAETSARAAAENLSNLDPTLRPPLTYSSLVKPDRGVPPTIFTSAQGRIARVLVDDRDPRSRADSADPMAVSCFRQGVATIAKALPDFSSFLPMHWEGLDAACACALAAAGLGPLTYQQVVRARSARAEELLSFTDMYAACLSALARGQKLVCLP
jgi:hypothetical protein